MITIHEQKSSDFTTLGLGALTPSECIVEEEAGGIYELTLTQPMTQDARHKRIVPFRIIKAPAPVRETPLIDLSQIGTTSRDIYKVTTDGRRLYLRAAPDQGAKGIKTYAPGTEVVSLALSDDGDWRQVAILDGGATGWMFAGNLLYVRSETVAGGTGIVQPRQTREQLFRVYRVLPDTKLGRVKAHAQHISYDLKGAIVVGEYKPEKVPANEVCAEIMARADHDVSSFNLYCTVTDPISGDFGGRNIINCLLDAESGIVAQTGAMVVRDNYDIFILPPEERSRGVELRYGKNLLSAELDTSSADIVTRIRPVGRNSDGTKLYLPDNDGFVDSTLLNDYPVPYAREIEYDVVVSSSLSEADALAQLRIKAKEDLSVYEKLSIALDADFVRLDLTEKYRHLANAYAMHLYDRVSVIDRDAGIDVTVAMCCYKFDALLEQYSDTELNDVKLPIREEEVEEITASYPLIHSDSYRGGWNWYEDNDIRQGYITSGRIRGCMWFDNDAIRAELGGKTVKQASLSLYPMKGVGRGVAVSVELYGTTVEYADRMSYAPALTTSYGVIGSATPGEVTTITIPTQAAADLINGTINALMVYSSDTELHGEKNYSRNYARFAGETSADEATVPVLTIVTEGRAADDVTVTVDAEGNMTISGTAVTVDSEGNATIDGAAVATDGNMTIE